ncbi:hypothetical protein [Amycolatopsis keratiniphila]|uniref:Uncharacterized protein n=1 Tax=Amycolatopsis keratiniphila TaxID=129921 RepID=R4T1R9_9PSEU|nr:hypothetical protein [Amycolatopsis keratiniphila]AGM09549.1 hypothetical protein AORI_6967 [Amycolatopsis keratiniphila]
MNERVSLLLGSYESTYRGVREVIRELDQAVSLALGVDSGARSRTNRVIEELIGINQEIHAIGKGLEGVKSNG